MSEAKPAPRRKSAIPDERIVLGPLPGYLGYQIRQAQSAIFRDFPIITADLKVSPGEFGLLTLLDANPGVSQVKLAAVYGLDKSTLSIALNALVKRGLIRRAKSDVDLRYHTLRLLPAGRALLRRVRERVEAQERIMDCVLKPGERAKLLDMLQRITRAFAR
jgi:DNA-binding MarR family transcriptional regulator